MPRLELLRTLQRRPDRREQPFARHLEKVETRLAFRGRQIRCRIPSELQDLAIRIDENSGRRVVLEQHPLRIALESRSPNRE